MLAALMLAVSGAVALTVASPTSDAKAYNFGCTNQMAAYSWTTAIWTNSCISSRARLVKYISAYPTTYTANWNTYKSAVSYSGGAHVGNYARVQYPSAAFGNWTQIG